MREMRQNKHVKMSSENQKIQKNLRIFSVYNRIIRK
jgi:hypothetical protein